jgi:hypothetical protein
MPLVRILGRSFNVSRMPCREWTEMFLMTLGGEIGSRLKKKHRPLLKSSMISRKPRVDDSAERLLCDLMYRKETNIM